MKYYSTEKERVFKLSLPSWERGLKSKHSTLDDFGDKVAPLVGAWIEILSGRGARLPNWSLPSWERGLKLKQNNQLLQGILSLPSWERGLKCIYVVIVIRSGIVAPLVGAWIEIILGIPNKQGNTGRSPRGSVD